MPSGELEADQGVEIDMEADFLQYQVDDNSSNEQSEADLESVLSEETPTISHSEAVESNGAFNFQHFSSPYSKSCSKDAEGWLEYFCHYSLAIRRNVTFLFV